MAAQRVTATQAKGGACQLSGFGQAAGACGAGWLGAPALAAPARLPLLTVAGLSTGPGSWTTAVAGSTSSADGGEAAGGSRPGSPTPGPAPAGAAGGAAMGGSGIAVSIFLSLACLLLLAAPHAMRRLRLACLPRRTAFFVLIPERPG